jgi:hypothetical protein
MNKPITLIFSAFILLFACDEEKDENKGFSVLTVDVEMNALQRGDMKWIYISEPGGRILDSDIVHVGTFTLNAEVIPETVDVTIYSIVEFGGFKQHSLITIREVAANQTFHFRKPNAATGNVISGVANFEISNCDPFEPVNNFVASAGSSNGFSFPPFITINNGVARGSVRLFTELADVLFVARRDQQRVYTWAQNVGPNSVIKLDLDNFTPIDYRLSLPQNFTSGFVAGYKQNLKFHIGSIGYELGYPGPTLGYIDGFDYYETFAGIYQAAYHVNYFKMGSRPSSIVFPLHKGKVVNSSISNFDYFSETSHDYYAANFSGTSQPISWEVIGPSPDFKITFLPKELRESFPSFDLSQLFNHHAESRIYVDGYGYRNFVDSYLDRSKAPKFYEFYQILDFAK